MVMTIFTIFKISIEWSFSFVSTFTVPPIAYVFPPLLYLKMIRENYFEKNKRIHFCLFGLMMIIGFSIWVFSMVALFYTRITKDDQNV